MFRSPTSTKIADRRGFLALAIAGAAAVPFSGSASAHDKHRHVTATETRRGAQNNVRKEKTLQTAASLRDLWIGHIFWIRNVAIAAIDKNDSAVKAAEQQAVANAQAIAESIEPFYGAVAQEGFFKLLAGHYGAVKAYLLATVAGDAPGQGTATQSLTANAGQIAAFLSAANPYLPKEAVEGLLVAHGGHHIQQIQQLKDRNYDAEARTWEEMKNHVYQIADATADALTKQFSKKFT